MSETVFVVGAGINEFDGSFITIVIAIQACKVDIVRTSSHL